MNNRIFGRAPVISAQAQLAIDANVIALKAAFKAQMHLPLQEIKRNFPDIRKKLELSHGYFSDVLGRVADEAKRIDVLGFLSEEHLFSYAYSKGFTYLHSIIDTFSSQMSLPLDEIKKSVPADLDKLPAECIYKIYYFAVKEKRLDVLKFLADELNTPLVRPYSFGNAHRNDTYDFDFFECDLDDVFNAAIENDDLDILRWLIGEKKYLSMDFPNPCYRLLDTAFFKGNLKILKYLVEVEKFDLNPENSDLSGEDYECPSAVTIAISLGRLDILEWLVKDQKQSNFDFVDLDAIHTACSIDGERRKLHESYEKNPTAIGLGRLEILKWLIEKKGFNLTSRCHAIIWEKKDQSEKTKNGLLETIFHCHSNPGVTLPILAWLLSENSNFAVESFKNLDEWLEKDFTYSFEGSYESMKLYCTKLSAEEAASIVVDLKKCIDLTAEEASDEITNKLHDVLKIVIAKAGLQESINEFIRADLFDDLFTLFKLDTFKDNDIVPITKAELLLHDKILPLDENNSPLNVKSTFLSADNYRIMRSFQALYLVQHIQGMAAEQLRHRAHKGICNTLEKTTDVSELNWPLEAIQFYSLYSMYKANSAFNANMFQRFTELQPAQPVAAPRSPLAEQLEQHGSYGVKRWREDDAEDLDNTAVKKPRMEQ